MAFLSYLLLTTTTSTIWNTDFFYNQNSYLLYDWFLKTTDWKIKRVFNQIQRVEIFLIIYFCERIQKNVKNNDLLLLSGG